jgi:thiol-disulfide isomerase/thioredoxin
MAIRMSKKTWLIVAIVIIAVGAIVGIVLSRNSSSPSDSTLQSQKALNFTLSTMTGANIALSELEGTPVVLNFWATTCGHCLVELPYFEAVAQKSEGTIKVIAINVGQPLSEVERFFGGYEPTMIVALDGSGETFVNYCQKDNPRGYIPITFFTDSEGIVQHIRIGAFQSETELWDALHDVFGITIP